MAMIFPMIDVQFLVEFLGRLARKPGSGKSRPVSASSSANIFFGPT
jgi:hypothetical protein